MSEETNSQWEAPPPPEKIEQPEKSEMSEVGTVANIFIEPGRTFEDLRKKSRFILAGLILIFLFSLFQIAFVEKIGLENIVRNRFESSSFATNLPKEEKESRIARESGPIAKYATYGATPIVMIIVFLIGGLIYWLAGNAMGGTMTFLRGVSIWVYSSLPQTVLFTASNLLVLFLKNVDEIEIGRAQQGLIQANPAFFLDGKSQPVLSALLGSFDLFSLIGWIFAAIGLKVVGKLSTGAAWSIVLLLALIATTVKVIVALVFG